MNPVTATVLFAASLQLFELTLCASNEAECRGIARYEVTFYGEWSRKMFPKMYPMYRPPAQWSKLIGRTHDNDYHLFSVDALASKGFQQFAEKGATILLDQESQGSYGIYDSFTAAKIPQGVGQTSAKVFVDGGHTLVSFATKIVPSPDWFVGIDGLDLCKDGDWISSSRVDLQPMDAGTDQGLTFTSPNWPSKPHQKIYQITSQYPKHKASSFFYPRASELPRMGHLEVRLIQWIDGEPIVPDDDGEMGELVNDTDGTSIEDEDSASGETGNLTSDMMSLDCDVSEWSAWSPCSKTCGFGQQTRHRVIVEQAQNGGAVCPPLSEQQLCGSMRSCKWKHFDFNRFG